MPNTKAQRSCRTFNIASIRSASFANAVLWARIGGLVTSSKLNLLSRFPVCFPHATTQSFANDGYSIAKSWTKKKKKRYHNLPPRL